MPKAKLKIYLKELLLPLSLLIAAGGFYFIWNKLAPIKSNHGWQNYKIDSAKCVVKFPHTPSKNQRSVPTKIGVVNIQYFHAKDTEAVYTLATATVPSNKLSRQQKKSLVVAIMNRLTKKQNTISNTVHSYNGLTFYESKYMSKRRTQWMITERTTSVNDRLYVLFVGTPKNGKLTKFVTEQFFKSFKITK